MNKINMNLKLTAFILLVATAFTSCLKDKGAEWHLWHERIRRW